jgi:hypothetical protein
MIFVLLFVFSCLEIEKVYILSGVCVPAYFATAVGLCGWLAALLLGSLLSPFTDPNETGIENRQIMVIIITA